MQAIETKVLAATNTRPTRIKASCARGSVVVSADGINLEVSSEGAHVWAAQHLVEKFINADRVKYGPGAGREWAGVRVAGSLPNGNWAHVFVH
jgi:hypothetical protein